MILVDANLLNYAVNQDLPHHERSKLWWETRLSGSDAVVYSADNDFKRFSGIRHINSLAD